MDRYVGHRKSHQSGICATDDTRAHEKIEIIFNEMVIHLKCSRHLVSVLFISGFSNFR